MQTGMLFSCSKFRVLQASVSRAVPRYSRFPTQFGRQCECLFIKKGTVKAQMPSDALDQNKGLQKSGVTTLQPSSRLKLDSDLHLAALLFLGVVDSRVDDHVAERVDLLLLLPDAHLRLCFPPLLLSAPLLQLESQPLLFQLNLCSTKRLQEGSRQYCSPVDKEKCSGTTCFESHQATVSNDVGDEYSESEFSTTLLRSCRRQLPRAWRFAFLRSLPP